MNSSQVITGDESFQSPPRPRRAPQRSSVFFAPTLLGSRTIIAKTTAPGRYAAQGRTLGWQTADPAYGNRFTSTGKELLVARNGGSTAVIVTVRSIGDSALGRLGDQSLSIAPGDTAHFGPFPTNGWRQPDGYIYVDSATADITLAVVLLP